MRRRPAVTMLSGPAASVAGALMHLKVSDGIYFEVGGTSTNIGVIRNGRPTVKHAKVGGHDTYVNSLDVRVLGIAGGSMPRVRGNEIVDVGPRSAHIAGLHYAAFAAPTISSSRGSNCSSPKDGDPDDYVAIRCANGERYAITDTCAANVLGYAKPGWHACGNAEAARRAMAPLAAQLGVISGRCRASDPDQGHRQGHSGGRRPDPRIRARSRPGDPRRRRRRCGGADSVRRRAHGPAVQDLAGRGGHLFDRRGVGDGARDRRARDSQSDAR